MNRLRNFLTCTDLNRVSGYDRSLLRRVNDVCRCSDFFSVDATSPVAEISNHRRSLWIAICVYLLVAITKKRLKIEQTLYTILQILSVSVFEKMSLLQAFQGADRLNEGGDFCNQLSLWD